MSTTLSKNIAILFGIVFFASGVSFAVAALDPIGSGQGSLLDPTATPSFGGQGSLLDPTTSGGQTSRPINLGGTATTPINTTGSQLINTTPATTAVMANAVTTNTQAQAAVASTQAAYTAALASGNSAQIAATQAAFQTAKTNLANLSAASGITPTADDENLRGINCNVTNGWIGEGTFADCIPITVYYLIYKPTSYLLMGSGYIFDKTLTLSIDQSIVDQQFVSDSWKIIRDFSNMLFIFILLYTGIMTMFGSKDWKRTVIQVIVIALLINFSLFFTKIVIDAGNILATGIYSSINTGTSFSASLAGKFQPQVFLDTAGKVDPVNATIVFIIASIVSVFAAWVFFKAALLFIGRLLAFWFLMIVSPFAFISIALPKMNMFDKWLGKLTSQAFVAPVFLFLLYIIMQVLSAGGGILSSLGQASGTSWFDQLIAPILIAILIILALQKSLEFAADMAGDFGKLGAKIGGAVMGVAGGAVLGGAAVVGRTTIGRAAQRLEESGKLRQWAGSDSKFKQFAGRNLMGATDKARQGTFDARGLSTVQKAAGAAGVASIGKPWAGAKGGFEGEQKRQGEKDEKFAKRLEMTDDEKKAIAATHGVSVAEEADKKQKEEVAKHTATVSVVETEVKAAQKKAEDARVAHEASRDITGVGDAALAKALADATKEEQDALSKLKGAQSELATATGLAATATAAAEKAKKVAEAVVEAENKRRAGKFAEYVEGRTFVPTMGTYSHKQAQQTADKIRKGESKDDKAQKDWEKKMKKMMEEMAKGEGKPEEGVEKKTESPAQ